MTIRIGANPIGWSNDDMQEIGGWIPLEQCLSEAKARASRAWSSATSFRARREAASPSLTRTAWRWSAAGIRSSCSSAMPKPNSPKPPHHRKLLKDMGTDVFIVAECTRTVHGDKSKPLSDPPGDDRGRMEDASPRASRGSPSC